LLVGNKDLGNSVRRIMARVFDDHILTEYSLYGMKKKSPFSKLLMYRVIIGKNILFCILSVKMNSIILTEFIFWLLIGTII